MKTSQDQKDLLPFWVVKLIQRPCINSSDFLVWNWSNKGFPQNKDSQTSNYSKEKEHKLFKE